MKSRVMALADLESGDSYFVVDNPLPVVTSRGRKKGKKGRRALGSFFHKDVTPRHADTTS